MPLFTVEEHGLLLCWLHVDAAVVKSIQDHLAQKEAERQEETRRCVGSDFPAWVTFVDRTLAWSAACVNTYRDQTIALLPRISFILLIKLIVMCPIVTLEGVLE